MNRTLATRMLALAAAIAAQIGPGITAKVIATDVWVPIYSTDFSSNPGWITNDPVHMARDPATQTFHGWQANSNTSCAYTIPAGFDPTKSFKLEFDFRLNSCQWSAGLNFGLWDSRLHIHNCVSAGFSLVDNGFGQSLTGPGGQGYAVYTPSVSTGIDYHSVLHYDTAAQKLSLVTTNRDTGASLHSQSITVSNVPATLNRLGVSRLFMEGYNYAAVDYNLDNVRLYQKVHQPEFYGVLVGGTGGSRRGDIDAQHIYSALVQIPGVKSDNISVVTTVSELNTTMASVTGKLQPGDSLLFFYSGHGAYANDGTEPQITNSTQVKQWSGDVCNNGDEWLYFDSAGITDDTLTQLLSSDPKLADVRKLAILDTCFTGGFWGKSGNETDVGDLEKLANAAIIAASPEEEPAYYLKASGRGLLSIALEDTLKDLSDPGASLALSTIELGLTARYINGNFSGEVGISGSPWVDSEILVPIEGNLGAVIQSTPDFDTSSSLVPEPASLSILAFGVMCLAVRRQRR